MRCNFTTKSGGIWFFEHIRPGFDEGVKAAWRSVGKPLVPGQPSKPREIKAKWQLALQDTFATLRSKNSLEFFDHTRSPPLLRSAQGHDLPSGRVASGAVWAPARPGPDTVKKSCHGPLEGVVCSACTIVHRDLERLQHPIEPLVTTCTPERRLDAHIGQ